MATILAAAAASASEIGGQPTRRVGPRGSPVSVEFDPHLPWNASVSRHKYAVHPSAPKIFSAAFLGPRLDWGTPNANALRDAAQLLGRRLFLAEPTFTDYAAGFALMAKERPDALFVPIQPASAAHSREIFDFALEHRIPATCPWLEVVTLGGLMSYGTNVAE
jgi:hypothetical protein